MKLEGLKLGDVLYCPLAGYRGEYLTALVVGVDLVLEKTILNINGWGRTVRPRDLKKYRKTPPGVCLIHSRSPVQGT